MPQSKPWASAVRDAFHADVTRPVSRWAGSGQPVWWLMGAMLVAVAVRGYFLAQPMRYDESYTFLNFANGPLSNTFFYYLPNNHVLHTLLVSAVTSVFGGHPAAIRLPAVLAGVATIPLVYALCRQLHQSGIFAAFTTAVAPMLVSYSTNARGYSLVVLLSVGIAMIGMAMKAAPSIPRAVLFGLVAAFGMLAVPVMLLPVVGVTCWLVSVWAFRGGSAKAIVLRFLVPMGGVFIGLTVLLYVPVILVTGGAKPIVAHSYLAAQPWPEFFHGAMAHAETVATTFCRDIPIGLVAVGGLMAVLGVYSAVHSRHWALLGMVPLVLAGAIFVVLVRHRLPFVRTWLFLIPFLLVLADAGFTFLVNHVPRRIGQLLNIGVLVIALDMAVTLTATNAIAKHAETGHFPEAELVAIYLKPKMRVGDRVTARMPVNWPMNFYLWYHQVPDPQREPVPGLFTEYFVVQRGGVPIANLTRRPVQQLLVLGETVVYRSLSHPGP